METRTDIIRELCKANGITIAALERKLGMGNGTIGKYGGFNMRSDRLKAVADYFHVTMEYLMTGSDPDMAARPIYPDLSLDALELAKAYMNLSPELKNAVRRTAGLEDLKEKEGLSQAL